MISNNKSLWAGLAVSAIAVCAALSPYARPAAPSSSPQPSPRPWEALMQQAQHLAKENRVEEAENLAAEALKEAERADDTTAVAAVLGRMAEFASARGDGRQASIVLQKLEGLKPKSFTVYHESARAALFAKKLPAARTWIDLALSEKPDDPDALMTLTQISREAGRPDEAIRAYERLIAVEPKEYWVYIQFANYCRAQGKFHEAMRIYARARAVDPDRIDSYFEESYAHLAAGEYAEAEHVLTRTLSRHPRDREIYHHLGAIYHTQGKFTEAEACYKKALALTDPKDGRRLSHTYLNLGQTLWGESRFDEAEKAWQTGFEDAPPGGENWVNIGSALIRSYYSLHKLSQARLLRKKVLDLCEASRCGATSYTGLLSFLAQEDANEGDYAKAKQLAAKALKLYEEFPEVAAIALQSYVPIQIATTYIRSGEDATGEGILRKEISKYSETSDPGLNLYLASAMRNLADLYMKEKRLGEAEPLYRKALAIFKRHPELKEEQAAVTKALDGLHNK